MQFLKTLLLVKITINSGLNSFPITHKHHNKLKKLIVFRDECTKTQKVRVKNK